MTGAAKAVESYVFRAFQFRGRAGRGEYGWVFLAQVVLYAVCVIADLATLSAAGMPSLNPLAYATVIFFLLNIVPGLALTARRLHDTGRSAFWMLVLLLPGVGLLWFGCLMVKAGDAADNGWGPAAGPAMSPGDQRPATGSRAARHNPWQSYAVLLNAERQKSEEERAAQREQVAAYYREKVLRDRANAA